MARIAAVRPSVSLNGVQRAVLDAFAATRTAPADDLPPRS